MNIFKTYTFRWWQIGVLKLAVLAFGVAIGAYWSAFFVQYLTALIVLGVVCSLYVFYAAFSHA